MKKAQTILFMIIASCAISQPVSKITTSFVGTGGVTEERHYVYDNGTLSEVDVYYDGMLRWERIYTDGFLYKEIKHGVLDVIHKYIHINRWWIEYIYGYEYTQNSYRKLVSVGAANNIIMSTTYDRNKQKTSKAYYNVRNGNYLSRNFYGAGNFTTIYKYYDNVLNPVYDENSMASTGGYKCSVNYIKDIIQNGDTTHYEVVSVQGDYPLTVNLIKLGRVIETINYEY